MAGQGRAPKFPEQRRNTSAPLRGEWVELPAERREVPPLPEGDWSARSASSWSAWWSDPAATQWSESQFDEIVALLELAEEFWSGSRARAQEMRLRMDGLGLTLKGKRDLRWRIVAPEAVRAPKPAAKGQPKLKVVL